MNMPQIGLRFASALAGTLCAAHLLRLMLEVPVRVGSFDLGYWPSAMVVMITGTLSVWFWQLAKTPYT